MQQLSTLQYMGSKSRIIRPVHDEIMSCEPRLVMDLFAGTGSVGESFIGQTKIVSNDLERYAYITNEAVLNGCMISDDESLKFWEAFAEMHHALTSMFSKSLHAESALLCEGPSEWERYRSFCELTPYVGSRDCHSPETEDIFAASNSIANGQAPGLPCLFTTYFANAYFGVAQCCEIDAIRTAIDTLQNPRQRFVFLLALMSSMSECASTTTHFAQYLKVKSERTCSNIMGKRSRSIASIMKMRLAEYANSGLLSRNAERATCLNLDYADALKQTVLDDRSTVYADPPYFKEHYSRYYHVLNTLCLYDYPDISLNPQTKLPTVGRYRTDRASSPFGRRKSALGAFESMAMLCAASGASLVISYSDNSIVQIEDLNNVVRKYFSHVVIKTLPLRHSSQGRKTEIDRMATEFLITGRN